MVMMPRSSSLVVGVSVSSLSVSAVALRAGRIVWTREVSRSGEQPVEESLIELLESLPKAGMMRPRIHACVGAQSSQVRNVGEQAWSRDRQLACAIVGESPGRFFLVNGTPIVTTDVQPSAGRGMLVGAIDRPIVDALALVCRRLRLRLVLVSPAAAVLGHAIEGARAVLRDGDLSLVATYEDAQLATSRRVRSAEVESDPSTAVALHRELRAGDDGGRFMAAFGAARAGDSVRLAIRPKRDASGNRRRVITAASACALAGAFALAGPPLAAVRRADDARASKATIARSGERALETERRLGDAAVTLGELRAFARGTRSATLLLASLSEAIEHPTMLLSLQADTLGGTLVALTPRASALMAMLDTVPEIAEARIMGPVTLQQSFGPPPGAMPPQGMVRPPEGAPPMERVTVRFSWRGPGVAGARREDER